MRVREPPPAGAAPALAKGTASVELAGRAERATAATHEALGPGTYGEAARRRKTTRHDKARSGVKLR